MANVFETLREQNHSDDLPIEGQVTAEAEPFEINSEVSERSSRSYSAVNRTRNKTMNLRFTPEELYEMNEKISKSRMSKTDFVLKCIRNQDVIIVEDLSEAMTEFRRQGVNLNQIAKSLNEYAVGLSKYGVQMNNENGTWRAITMELETLREENLKTQELLKEILGVLNRQ